MNTQELPTEARRWLSEVDRGLQDAAPADRREVIEGFHGHLVEALAEGRPITEVLAGLGSTEAAIDQTRDELGLGAGPRPGGDAGHLLATATAALSLLTTIVMILFSPTRTVPSGEIVWTLLTEGLEPWMVFLCILPTVATLLPLLARRSLPRGADVAVTLGVAIALTVWVVVAMASIGWFWAPTALLAWFSWAVPRRIRSTHKPSRGVAWAVVAALPATLLIGGLLNRTVEAEWPGTLIPLFAPLVVALALSIRSTITTGLVVTAGLAVMAIGVISADLLMLAFWVVGGCYVALGCGRLAQAKAAPGRRPFSARSSLPGEWATRRPGLRSSGRGGWRGWSGRTTSL